MQKIAEFREYMSVSRSVVILTHFKPDADALGSSLGLAGFLKKKGHLVTVISPSDYPDFLSWMPGADQVIALSKKSTGPLAKATDAFTQADLIFCLDFSSLSRIND